MLKDICRTQIEQYRPLSFHGDYGNLISLEALPPPPPTQPYSNLTPYSQTPEEFGPDLTTHGDSASQVIQTTLPDILQDDIFSMFNVSMPGYNEKYMTSYTNPNYMYTVPSTTTQMDSLALDESLQYNHFNRMLVRFQHNL